MCGIAGILDYRPESGIFSQASLEKMLSALRHRGPDDQGVEVLPLRVGGALYLGHRRLSIIDLSPAGHQPMANASKSVYVTTNGEIYNYRELRLELQSQHQFRTNSDTEALLKAYESWGAGCLEKLRGMFAFVIWDEAKQSLFLARDRLGIKPLYYYAGANCFIFASEIRAIQCVLQQRAGINAAGLYQFLAFGCLQSPQTILESICELKPAHSLTVTPANGELVERRYWTPWSAVRTSASRDELTGQIGSLLQESMRLRLVSDVPVGVFLSGGIDSSGVCSLLSKTATEPVRALSIIFSETAFDESVFAAQVAKAFGCPQQTVLLREADLLQALPSALAAMDQPTIDGINTYLISRSARESGLKVILSGLGGDEVFAGYGSFKALPRLLRAEKWLTPRLGALARTLLRGLLPASDRNTKLLRWLEGSFPGIKTYFLWRALFCHEQIEKLFKNKIVAQRELNNYMMFAAGLVEPLAAHDEINQISYLELTQYMANMLLRDTDVMSMAHALEVRVPLIDHKLVEHMFTIPGAAKLDPRKPKPLLTDSLPARLPDSVVFRKKMGFTLPFAVWMRTHLRAEMETVLLTPVGALAGVIDEATVMDVWRQFLRGETAWSRPWALYVLKKWVERNL